MKRPGLAFLLSLTLAVALLAAPLATEAQPSTNIPRIGFLTAVPLSVMSARTEAFRQGLRELGYVEGKTIVIEWRSAEGQLGRLPSLAAELVRLNVDVIVTAGPLPTRPVKAATVTIPIVITWQGWAKAIPDSKATFIGEYASGDTAIIEVVWRGTHTGPLQAATGTIPPSNKRIELPACQVIKIEGGKVKSFTHYFDMATLLRQIGALKS